MFGKKKNKSAIGIAGKQRSVSVHTMADDLSGNTDVVATTPQYTNAAQDQSVAQSTQTESPFLQQSEKADLSDAKTPVAVKNVASQGADVHGGADTVIEKTVINRNGGGVVTMVLSLFFLGLLVAVGWFAWSAGLFDRIIGDFSMPKMHIVKQPDLQEEPSDSVATAPNDANTPSNDVTVDQSSVVNSRDARFVPADATITISSQAAIADVVEILKTVAMQKGASVVVFDVVRDTGTPISLGEFAKQFLPHMPPALLSILDQPVQIYVMKQSGEQRIGLHTYTSQSNMVRNYLRSFETHLITGLSPLFLFTPSSVHETVFDDSAYKGVPIRFYNFVPDATQSVDYAIHYDHVFLGTSRVTMHMMMDHVFAHDDAMTQEQMASNSSAEGEEEDGTIQIVPVAEEQGQLDTVNNTSDIVLQP